MELESLFHRVIGLDVHQAQVTACAILTDPDGNVTIERWQFGAFRKDRKALALSICGSTLLTYRMEAVGRLHTLHYAVTKPTIGRTKHGIQEGSR